MPGLVVCPHPRAAEEGVRVLEASGNAFDAAVATAFLQMVVAPFSCGVAGMISAHLLAPASGVHEVIDGCLRAGSLVTEEMWAEGSLGEAKVSGSSLFEDFRSTMGYTSICTPGAVAGLFEMHRRHCTLPWSELLAPAIHTAREGFPVTPELVNGLEWSAGPYDPDGLTRIRANAECARIYLRRGSRPRTVPGRPELELTFDGEFHAVGEVIRNPDYADTLEQIAQRGATDFYRGDLAEAMAIDLERNGAFVTHDDLRDYRPKIYSPSATSYRGYQIHSNSSPGAGPLLQEALNVLDGLDLGELEHGGVDYLSYLASTFQLVNQDRKDYVGDPEVIGEGPGKILLSEERADRLRAAVLDGVVGGDPAPAAEPETTHLSVVDGEGNVASITHSLGTISGVVTPGLGFIHNNGMNRFDPRPGHASSLAPGKARLHLMMPSIAFKVGGPAIVLGAPGGNAILSALVQVLSNVVDFGMTAVEAVSAPRIHAEGATVSCEARTREDICNALRARGFTVDMDPASLSGRMARAQLIIIGVDGHLEGGSDPRGGGAVMRTRS